MKNKKYIPIIYMSGQPVNFPSDVIKFRKEYLRTLAQMEANDEKNLQANRLYKQTGVAQQPLDTRSVEEKLKDIENLKPEIRSQLLELMDGGNAEKVVQNVSASQLMFLAQAMPLIIETLKPRYTRGILADVFIAELNKLIVAEARKDDFVKPADEDFMEEDTPKTTSTTPTENIPPPKSTKRRAKKSENESPTKKQRMTIERTKRTRARTKKSEDESPTKKQRMIGSGLKLTEADIDRSVGVPATPRFIPLGRYIINKKQLDKDIVSIKTKTGKQIAGFNSQKVSSKLGGTLRKIISGFSPTFEEVNELTDDEKNYLHKVASKAEIIDRLSIPAPNKLEDDKDINQFEIMKGQILSGNDSTELIKKFKLIILKLVRKELIPKREANDMLFELTHLGY